jgi:hypothetical protein
MFIHVFAPADNSAPEAGGYPDFIQDTSDPEGVEKIYIMETNKKVCRLHLIPGALSSRLAHFYFTLLTFMVLLLT